MQTALAVREQIKADLIRSRGTVPPLVGRQISTKGRVFSLPTGESSPGPIDAVILDWRNYNRYYTQPYAPQKHRPPACFAISKDIFELAPHEEAALPQHVTCVGCPFNKWGSSPTGRAKACRNTVRLAIAPLDAVAQTDPMILVVSPTGLKAWSSLVNGLGASGLHPIQSKTAIAFDSKQSYPTLQFSTCGINEDVELYWVLREKAQALLDAPPQQAE